MLNLIKKVFEKTIHQNKAAKKHKDNSETELQIATCALLLEIACADDEFSEEEEQRIEELMQSHFDLPVETYHEIKSISEKRQQDSIDLWQFANTIKDNYSLEQKKKVIEMIWRVIYADKKLDDYEDYLVHKIAKLLGVGHKQLIDAKLKAKKT